MIWQWLSIVGTTYVGLPSVLNLEIITAIYIQLQTNNNKQTVHTRYIYISKQNVTMVTKTLLKLGVRI